MRCWAEFRWTASKAPTTTPGIGAVGPVSLDFIQEVKVLTNNYQAEFGGNSGALINVVQKSGTTEYHGNVSWFTRNEDLNANDFFSNRNGFPRPLYRFNTFTGALGGPIAIPKVFTALQKKMFFFYGHETWRVAEPSSCDQCDDADSAGARRRLFADPGCGRKAGADSGSDNRESSIPGM